MSKTTTMPTEELARRLGVGKTAMIQAARRYCRVATPISGKLCELEIGLLIGAAVQIATEGKRIDYMITLFANLTGGQVNFAEGAPEGLRTADNDAAPDPFPPGPVVMDVHANEAPQHPGATMACPHGVPPQDLCTDCDKGAA